MPESISSKQEVMLEIVRSSSFNGFDGEWVAKDLIENPELWEAALMELNGITLRDLPDDYFNVDALFVSVPRAKEADFLKMTQAWGADECDVVQFELNSQWTWGWSLGSSSDEKALVVYRLWWD